MGPPLSVLLLELPWPGVVAQGTEKADFSEGSVQAIKRFEVCRVNFDRKIWDREFWSCLLVPLVPFSSLGTVFRPL